MSSAMVQFPRHLSAPGSVSGTLILRRPDHRRNTKTRAGATMTLLALMMPVVLAIAAYSINLVYMETARTELQISTDVATRAAGRMLAATGDQAQAIAAADRLFAANPHTNHAINLNGTDIVFGASTRDSVNQRYQFQPAKKPNAVSMRAVGADDVPLLFPTFNLPIHFRPIKRAISTQIELDISIVLDRSGSMAFSSDEPSMAGAPASAPPGWGKNDPVPPNARWLDTVAAVTGFLEIMEDSNHDERVSLTTYSNRAKTDVELTPDYDVITQAMQAHSNRFAGGATNIGGGILDGAKSLSEKKLARPWASRVLIVMSDGIHNTGTLPVPAAAIAAQQKIMIFTVTFSDEANQTQMIEVAEQGEGLHFHATNSEQLAQAFRDIANSLPTLITF